MDYSDNLIPAMTSTTEPSGTVFGSPDWQASYASWKAFDRTSAYYLSQTTANPYIGYQFPTAHAVTKYSIKVPAGDGGYNYPSWVFQGSNNGVSWDTLDTQTSISWVGNETKTFEITNTTEYIFYKIQSTNFSSYGQADEIAMYEYSNIVPNTPTNSTPANSATNISRNPTLTASAFSDPDAGDTHATSQWQVSTNVGFTGVIWDSGTDTTNKTSTTINTTNGTFAGVLSGKTKLGVSTTYYWHVRYQDNNGGWSSYSTGTSFSTIPPSLNKNAVDVQSPWTIDGANSEMLPDAAAKPMTIGVAAEIPTFSAADGTIVVCEEDDLLYYRINGAWQSCVKT